jgi:hypothetical protein
LGAALAEVDLASLTGETLIDILRAEWRQHAHQQARVLAAMAEVGRVIPGDDAQRLPEVSSWAAGEIAAALTLTGVAAARELRFASLVVNRLPLVHAALFTGSIDRTKAWVFAEYLQEVSPAHATVICEELVWLAPTLTAGQLRGRLLRMIRELDPEHTARRYRRAIRGRGVVAYLAENGTVTVTAHGLPADEAAVAYERIDLLVAAAKRAGHPGLADQIRADVFLGLLDGSLHRLTETEIITTLLGHTRPEDRISSEDLVNVEDTVGSGEDRRTSSSGADANDSRTATSPPSADGEDAPVPAGDSAEPGQAMPKVGVEIRLGLNTAMGRDERCGEIPGLGPVPPEAARALVAGQCSGAEWRFAVTDPSGYLILAGVTHCRPKLPADQRGVCRRGVVELHTTAEELGRLAADLSICGPWGAVVADIDRQLAKSSEEGGRAERTGRSHRRKRAKKRPVVRYARGSLARHVEIRDRTCCFPGCRRAARKADKDHTRDHSVGGPTSARNIGPLCERHHRYKTNGWWRLSQPQPGQFHWTSPLGHSYRTRGEPIRPPTLRPQPGPTPPPPEHGPE